MKLAQADRTIERALAVGSVPPEMRQLWNRLESTGIEVQLFDRGGRERGEQEMSDRLLQLRMLEDGWDYNGNPGIVVLLTSDGAGYPEGAGFHSTLERMHRRGWRIEILSWAHACNQRMRRWAEEHEVFVPLDDFYASIIFLEPSYSGVELDSPLCRPGLQNLCRSGNTCRYRVLGGLVDASPTVRTAVRLTGLRICRRPTWPPQRLDVPGGVLVPVAFKATEIAPVGALREQERLLHGSAFALHVFEDGYQRSTRRNSVPYPWHLYASCRTNSAMPASLIARASLRLRFIPSTFRGSTVTEPPRLAICVVAL